jgi:hypothetical protein
MGIAHSRTQAEIDELMRQLSSLPKASTNASPEDIKKINDKWKHKSTVKVRSNGRVNRTRGK